MLDDYNDKSLFHKDCTTTPQRRFISYATVVKPLSFTVAKHSMPYCEIRAMISVITPVQMSNIRHAGSTIHEHTDSAPWLFLLLAQGLSNNFLPIVSP